MNIRVIFAVGFSAAVLGLANAAEPIVKWVDDIVSGVKDGFTLSAREGDGVVFAGGAAQLNGSSSAVRHGLIVSWDQSNALVGAGKLTVMVKYSGYDAANANYALLSLLCPNTSNEVVAYLGNTRSRVGLAHSATVSVGGTQNNATKTITFPAEGIMMLSIANDGATSDTTLRGTRFAVAAKQGDGSYGEFVEGHYVAGIKWSTQKFYGIKIGGTIAPIGSYYRPGMKIEGIAVFAEATSLTAANEMKEALLAKKKYVTQEGWVNERADTLGKTGSWTDGVAREGGTFVVDAAEGAVFTPSVIEGYEQRCDSSFTVRLSADEAVDVGSDGELANDIQGGVRIAEDRGTLKIQVVSGGGWVDFAAAKLGETYEVGVTFHYKKGVDDAEDSVTYILDDKKLVVPARANLAKRISEIFVANGTRIEQLLGACQLAKTVVVDLEIVYGEELAILAKDQSAAEAIASKMIIALAEEVAKALTSETAKAEYRKYFRVVAERKGEGFVARVELDSSVKNEVADELDRGLARVVESVITGKTAEIEAKAGLYYGLAQGNSPEALKLGTLTLATGAKLCLAVTRPAGAARQFYRLVCSPTPNQLAK